MQCHVCGTGVRPDQKFCMECGARLHRQPASELVITPSAGGPDRVSGIASDLPPVTPSDHPMFDPVTGQLLAARPTAALPPAPPDRGAEDDATKVLPAVGEPVDTFRGTPFAPPDPHAQGPGQWVRDTHDPPPVWPDEQIEYAADDRRYGTTRQMARQPSAPAPSPGYVNQPPYRSEQYEATAHLPATYAPWEGGDWEVATEPADDGPRFRIRPLLVLAILPAVAAFVGMFIGLVDIEPTGPLPFGPSKLNDFGTNQTVTGIVLAVAMLLGALAWCGGFRWGAGLAGGAGAGLAGWVVMAIGLAESRIAQAEAVNPAATVTRDIGYWSLVGAGAVGLLVLVTSLLHAGNDRRAGLDPWVAALGAIATIAAVLGPLIPLNDSNLDLNWSSPQGVDRPTLFFVARFVQLGLLLLCGVLGFLLVRRYGLGLAMGGVVGIGFLTLTTATEQTEAPIGPAVANPGSLDGKPYIVTIVGVGLMVFFGLVATVMALIDAD